MSEGCDRSCEEGVLLKIPIPPISVYLQPYVVGANFAWRPSQSSRDAIKALGSFFIGTSPEFDLALYTLCAFEFTNAICNVRLGGTDYRIQTWDINHKSGLQIGSAYPAI